MKGVACLFFILLASFSFSYEYETDSFIIKGSECFSKISNDKAVLKNNRLTTNFNGTENVLEISESGKTKIKTNDPLIDFLTQMAFQEVSMNINKDNVFSAGANWPTAWTRDMSYAIDLSLGFLFPETVQKSLEKRVENGFIIQDTGSGGSYPVSTDRIVWGIAAYAHSLYKNDPKYSKWVYDVLSKTLRQDLKVAFDSEYGLFKGETSFIDWREQSYPRWMDCNFIGNSFALSTNVLYYAAINRCSFLAHEFGFTDEEEYWKNLSLALKNSINKVFWNEEKSYYGMYFINQIFPFLYGAYETLGASLSVIEGVCHESSSYSMLNKIEPGSWGTSVFAPQLGAIPSYHNDSVWPFVQGYRILALKKVFDMESCEKEFASMVYSAMMFQTFKENQVSTHFSSETQTNSDRQLWSDAAWLSNIYRTIFGLSFESDGLHIEPFVFKSLGKNLELCDFNFANSKLNLKIFGTGNKIDEAYINGKKVSKVVIPYGESKVWNVEIKMKTEKKDEKKPVPSIYSDFISPQIPVVSYDFDGKTGYIKVRHKEDSLLVLFKNGKFCDWYDGAKKLEVKPSSFMDIYQFIAVPKDVDIKDVCFHPYLPSDQIRVESSKNTFFVEAEKSKFLGGKIKKEDFSEKPGKVSVDLQASIANFGSFIEKWGCDESDFIEFKVKVPVTGKYAVDIRYQNGNGPVNTGDKCALAFMNVNNEENNFPFIMAQTGSWSAWKFTASKVIKLNKGMNVIKLFKGEHSKTSKNRLNSVNVDLIRVSKISE